jgi:acyl carrier protein
VEIERLIREYIDENVLFSNCAIEYTNDTSFLAAGILDSMAVLELVGWVDATFGIKGDVRDVTPENFDSVNRLAAFIRAKTTTSRSQRAEGAAQWAGTVSN